MALDRRHLLGAALGALASPALARFPHTLPEGLVFFVGNSFTRQHAIPAQVCRIATAAGHPLHCHPNTDNGAKLADSTDTASRYAAERGARLPATVVLQDHSLEPLTPEGRARSAAAMAVYGAQFDATVLFETWPRRSDHPLYAEPGMPPGPEAMAAEVHDHYTAQARRLGARLAPIGLAWIEAARMGLDLWARDGYHANRAGAWLAALSLAHALDVPLDAVAPPKGMAPGTDAMLRDLARTMA